MTELGHNFDYTPFAMSNAFYESLPQDLQQIVDECAAEAVTYDRQICIDKEADYIKTIEDGGCQLTRLTDEQRQAFRDSTAGCLDFFKANYNPVIPVDDVLARGQRIQRPFPRLKMIKQAAAVCRCRFQRTYRRHLHNENFTLP